jgi:hypothetical protein
LVAWNPRQFLQQRRERKAREREVAEAQKAAAWEEADERTRGARDWLLRHLDSEARLFEELHEHNPEVFPAYPRNAAICRAASLRVADMYPTDPLLERLVALDDKGIGARMHLSPGFSRYGRDGETPIGLDGGGLLSAIVREGEEQWGLRPPGRIEHPAWGWWDEEKGGPVPLPPDA